MNQTAAGRSLVVVLLLTAVMMAGCETGDDACAEDRLVYNGHKGGGYARASWYHTGPVAWNFWCTEEQGALDDFRFALTLGDGQRFWLEPEEGRAENWTPIPTYTYRYGNGDVGRADPNETEADLMFGLYNWDEHADLACYRYHNEYSDRKGATCYEAFFALWNGTNAALDAVNPLPAGRYVVEIYMRDAQQQQTVLAVRHVRADGTMDWYACEKWPATGKNTECEGSMTAAEGMGDSRWPDHAGNEAQAPK